MLRAGHNAPDFTAHDQNGDLVSLRELRAKGPVILYFYPKDFTPVCTREACLFRDVHDELRNLPATLVGVSGDDATTHRAFSKEHDLPFSLLSDPGLRLARDYEAVHRLGFGTKRVTYVIDVEGVIRGAFHYELRAKRHVDEVRRTLGSL